MAINVPLTNYNSGEKISRHDLLNWVNETLSANYKKIEELCTGTAYCQLMEQIFPGSVAMKRLKVNAKMDHEYIWNLKLFQSAFTKLECDKTVPIDKLMKGKFQDNFEFLQWFKKFYDVNNSATSGSNAADKTNNNIILKPSSKNTTTAGKSSQSSSRRNSNKGTPSPRAQSPKKDVPHSPKKDDSQSPTKDGTQSPSNLQILIEERDTLKEHYETVEKEKGYYFQRLREVEILCDENEENQEYLDIIKKIRNLLYDTKEQVSAAQVTIENLEETDKPSNDSTEF